MNRLRTCLLAPLVALPLAHLLAACSFERTNGSTQAFNPGAFPLANAIFCDIEADRRCASNDDIMRGIDVARANDSGFWLGKSSPIGLDYSPAALMACGGGPQAVIFRDAFPTGTPVCLNPAAIGPGQGQHATINDACHAWCTDQEFVDGHGKPYRCDDIAWQSNGIPQPGSGGPGFANACTASGTLRPDFMDPRRVRPANPVAWTAVVGVAVSGSDLTKTAAQGWGSADPAFASGAVSTQQLLSGNGAVIVTASETNRLRIFGLGLGASSTTFEDVEFGLLMTQAGTLFVVESGTVRRNVGTYASGDQLEVAVEEGFVLYKKNQVVIYPITAGAPFDPPSFPAFPLRANAALNFTGATLSGARVTF